MPLRPFAAPLCPMHFFFNEITLVIGGRSDLDGSLNIMRTIFSIGNPAAFQEYLAQLRPASRLMEFNAAYLKGLFFVFTGEDEKVFGHVLLEVLHEGSDDVFQMEFAFYEEWQDMSYAVSIFMNYLERTYIQGRTCIVRAKHDGKNRDLVRVMNGKGFHCPTDVMLVKQYQRKKKSVVL